MTNAEQAVLFPTEAQERMEAAEAILQGFLDWHEALPVEEGDRKPVAWFANDVRRYFGKDPI